MLKRSLGLHQLRLVGAGIDVNQGVALADRLALTVVNGGDDSAGLRDDGGGVNRSHSADGFKVDADAPLGYGGDRRADGWLCFGLRLLGGRGFGVVATDDRDGDPAQEQQND